MNKTIVSLLMGYLLFLNTSCFPSHNENSVSSISYSNYDAITLSRTDLENSTKLMDSQTISKSGEIYIKDNYLIVNDPNKGFHIYDNTDPKNPIKLKFLQVLGSTDLAIKGNIIYANNAVDLITIVIENNFESIKITKRVRDIFPELRSPDGWYNSDTNIAVDWDLKTN